MKKILALVIMTIITFSQLSAFAMAESAEWACVINALTGDVVFSNGLQPCTYCKICNDAAAVSGNSRNADCASTGIKFR